ncbi:MAG: DUF2946 domain-containing protein [Burkholderiaceae bacterium]|nr:DUF2946 domain-containing protein [Burkholderiaceae bacterium]
MIAAFALAWVPAVSRALAAPQGPSAWAEVCTPQGTKFVTPDRGSTDAGVPSPLAVHLDHCPFCWLGSSLPGAPAPVAQAPMPVSLSHALPVLFLHGPRTLHAWTGVQARAPPVLS